MKVWTEVDICGPHNGPILLISDSITAWFKHRPEMEEQFSSQLLTGNLFLLRSKRENILEEEHGSVYGQYLSSQPQFLPEKWIYRRGRKKRPELCHLCELR